MGKPRPVPREILGDINRKARKVRLHAEIALIDREMDALKSSFGVQLYDAISEEGELPPKFSPLEVAYTACRGIVDGKVQEQDEKLGQIDSHQSQRLRAPQPTNTKERPLWVKDTVTTRSTDAKLKLQTLWLNHEIKMAKQAFGNVVFDLAIQMGNQQSSPEAPRDENSECVIQRLIDETVEAAEGPRARREEKVQVIALLTTTQETDSSTEVSVTIVEQ